MSVAGGWFDVWQWLGLDLLRYLLDLLYVELSRAEAQGVFGCLQETELL